MNVTWKPFLSVPEGSFPWKAAKSWVIGSTTIWLPGVMSGNTSTRATSLLKAISETATSSVLQLPVLVPAKPKVSSKNLSAEMTFTFWLTYATTT